MTIRYSSPVEKLLVDNMISHMEGEHLQIHATTNHNITLIFEKLNELIDQNAELLEEVQRLQNQVDDLPDKGWVQDRLP